ncbi:TPA: ABC transporter ATP-binding protein [Pseudomonas aeruginosa]|uniref:ABC transporter ATP-binding protein n=39 Tax=Pseudomonas TaxID=286 RepID=UPI0007177D73|nr:ABC transporter ATP-binding protein [Pseudomonas aeruginosa]EKY0767766.1 ABC transporter ATP-binding protein [Pseudomonas aeruginosa]KRV05253.1 microcin ABC transporter ATP-binding protein [Pseudomonas aeruginosa]MBH4506421.1 ABC transporter ATP-binding protein [Pseudomonas aeruginosa]VTR00789.1 ABC transporter ATP-binding protein [Pseudomonas aeruginosa]HCF6669123.1 ABC transporter ATP-binding protein [Pseudomonas aeruginosa]
MNRELLRVENLSVAYGDTQVVKGIDFSLRAGETLALVGESGSGKSQTAHALLRLLPGAARLGGSVRLDGEELLALSPQALLAIRGQRIGMVFQEPMTSLNPLQRIGRQVGEGLRLHRRLRGAALRGRVLELLELAGLEQPRRLLEAYPHQLSGGQRQRVMLAMALACEPQLLIADEPTTALDVTVQKRLLELLQSLQRRLGMAILLISHDLNLVRRVADRVCVMRDGQIVEENACETLFRSPRHPYTRLLIEAEPGGLAEPVACRETCLEVRALSLDYPAPGGWLRRRAGLRAVHEVSLRLRRGSTLGIVGESGSGKSSLGQALLRLLPAEGQILFQGERLDRLHGKRLLPLRRQFQAVFQDPYGSLNPRLSVEQIVGEGLRIHGIGDAGERRARVLEALREVGLDEPCLERYPHEFSGGQRQRQRIAIARALVLKPALILLDEPTSALDRSVQCQVVELLRRLQRRHGLSYLFISHDLAVVRALAHDILVLKDGRVVEQGSAAALFSQPRHPYTRELLGTMPALRLEEHLRVAGLGI